MPKEFKYFNELLPELKKEIASHLPILDLFNLSKTSKPYHAFFKPQMDVLKTLLGIKPDVANSNQLMGTFYKRTRLTDCSERTFENCSPFEYALWALDKHCWTMMLGCIPKDEAGSKVLKILSEQYHRVKNKGVTYRLHGKTITETHFDFKNTIIKELQTQVDSVNASKPDWDAIDKQWREGVGGAQKLLPMHAVYEYCSDEPFYPVPKFDCPPKRTQQFYNWITEKYENWFGVNSKLGKDFAIYKGGDACGGGGGVRCAGGRGALCGVLRAGASMKELCKVRTQDFINLKSEFEKQKPVDNQQVFQK